MKIVDSIYLNFEISVVAEVFRYDNGGVDIYNGVEIVRYYDELFEL